MAHSGYDRERFVNLQFETFQCIVCCEVVMEPWECNSCGKLFCKVCITDWMNKNPVAKCPNRCNNSKITPIFSKALQKMYQNLDVKCSNNKCNKVVKLMDLQKHEGFCLKVKCWNYENCQRVQNQQLKCEKPCCSSICQTLHQLQKNFGNTKKMYEIIGDLFDSLPVVAKLNSYNSTVKSLTQIGWDESKMGLGIALTDGNATCFLKEQSYVFRTAIGNIGFTSGVNYWEIHADPKTENQLKIGVTLSRQFDLNSAFCDNNFGFAYYGLGQLRYNSNASGPSYGKRFKKEGILGVCLNMNTGTLSFALNGEYFGVAYNDVKLKTGPIYPAVSLLHCAGCKIKAGMQLPSYFKD